jgi:hypothetical protein
MIHGEYYMKVGNGQQHHLLLRYPFGPLILLTLIAVPVSTTIEAKYPCPALITLVDPTPQLWRPATHNCRRYFGLFLVDRVQPSVIVPMFP